MKLSTAIRLPMKVVTFPRVFISMIASCRRSSLCCSFDDGVNTVGATPYPRGNHDPGYAAHQHRNANQCSDRPNGTRWPPKKNEPTEEKTRGGIEQKPSPPVQRTDLERHHCSHDSLGYQ